MDFEKLVDEIEAALERAGLTGFCTVGKVEAVTGRSRRELSRAITEGALPACQRAKGCAITLLRRHVAEYLAALAAQ